MERRTPAMIAQSFWAVAATVGWLVLGGVSRLCGGVWGLLWLLMLTALFVRRYVGRAGGREGVLLRARLSRRSLRVLVLGLAALTLAVWGFWFFFSATFFRTGQSGAALPLEMQQSTGLMRALYDALVFAPIVEEFGFRGRLLRALRTGFRPLLAVVISALVFACLHLQLWGFPMRFFLGLVCGMAVYRSRSIWMAVVLHAFSNGQAAAVAFLGAKVGFLAWGTPALMGSAAVLWLIAALCAMALWRYRPADRDSRFEVSAVV